MSGASIPPRPDGFRAIPEPPAPPAPGRPRATWRWWEAIAVYLAAILVSAFVTLPLVSAIHAEGLATLVVSAAAAIVIVGLLLLWLNRFHPTWRGAVGFPKRAWPEVRAGAAFGALLYPVVVLGVGLVVTLILDALTGHTVTGPVQVPGDLSAVGVITAVVYGVVIAPIAEELFFRGILFRAIRDGNGLGPSIVGSSVAFGLIHYIPAPALDSLLLMTVMMFTGAGLAYLYERRGNIVAPIVAHATFNVIGLVLIFSLR